MPTARCAECPAGVSRAEQACVYNQASAVLIRALKDHGSRGAADVIAGAMAARCAPPPPGATLVPVPISPARRRERGYNQAEAIARALSHTWGRECDADALFRIAGGEHQRGAGREARRHQVRGVFGVTARVPVCAWLVDDVVTTGATLSACAHALRRGGCREVGAVAFARVDHTEYRP